MESDGVEGPFASEGERHRDRDGIATPDFIRASLYIYIVISMSSFVYNWALRI